MTTTPLFCADFPSTHWTLIDQGVTGVGELFERYRPSLLAYLVRGCRLDGHLSEDLVQGFAATQLIENDLLAGADRSKGRFRWLLLKALNNHISKELRNQRRKKRHPGQAMVDVAGAAEVGTLEGEPVRLFEAAWARRVVDEAVARMRRECEVAGRDDLWQVFDQRLLQPMLAGAPTPSYESLIPKLAALTPSQASNLLISGKRVFARTLREVVAEYCRDPDEVEDEIRDLIRALGQGRA